MPCLVGRASASIIGQPGGVILVQEFGQSLPKVSDGLVDPTLKCLILESLPETRDHGVGLRFPVLGKALADGEALHLLLEVVGDILAAVVVMQGQLLCDAFPCGSVMLTP